MKNCMHNENQPSRKTSPKASLAGRPILENRPSRRPILVLENQPSRKPIWESAFQKGCSIKMWIGLREGRLIGLRRRPIFMEQPPVHIRLTPVVDKDWRLGHNVNITARRIIIRVEWPQIITAHNIERWMAMSVDLTDDWDVEKGSISFPLIYDIVT